MSWVNTHLQRQGDPDSCIKSPRSDRSKWPAHSTWEQAPGQQSRDGYPGCDTKAPFSHCRGLPGKGWGLTPFQNWFSTTVQAESNGSLLPCAALGRNIRRSLLNLCSVQTTPNWETSRLGFSSVRSSRILGNLFQYPIILKVFFFCLHPVWNSHFSLCLLLLNLQPWALVQSLAQLLAGTEDAVQSPEVFPSPGWSSPGPWGHTQGSVSGTDHCASSHSRFLCFSPPGPAGACQEIASLPVRPQPLPLKPVHQNQGLIH